MADGFSIREHVAMIRSIDVTKCWPFSSGVDPNKETMHSLLPPITVTKFRWWSHELHREPDKSTSRRQPKKFRTPKKRSVVEIFAVTPLIHKVDGDYDGDGSDHDKHRTMKKKKKNKKVSNLKTKKKLEELNGISKKKIRKFKRKEIDSNIKPRTQAEVVRKLGSSSCSKKSGEDILDGVSMKLKKAKHKETTFIGQSVLENSRALSHDKKAKTCNHDIAGKLNAIGFKDRSKVHSTKRAQATSNGLNLDTVLVDGNDDDVSIREESGNKAQLMTEKDELPHPHEHVGMRRHALHDVHSQENARQLLHAFVSPSQAEISDDDSVVVDHCGQTESLNCSHACNPRVDSMRKLQNPSVNSHVCAGLSRVPSSRVELTDYSGDHIPRVPNMGSTAHKSELPKLSSSRFALNETENNRFPLSSQSTADDISHTQQYRPYCCQYPMRILGDLTSFSEWKQKPVTSTQKYTSEEPFGLPLNSWGELNQATSTSFRGFDQLEFPNNTAVSYGNLLAQHTNGKYFSNVTDRATEKLLPSYQRNLSHAQNYTQHDQNNLLPVQNYSREKPFMYLPAESGVNAPPTEMPDFDFVNHDWGRNYPVSTLDSDSKLVTNMYRSCGLHEQAQSRHGSCMILPMESSGFEFRDNRQPTMRLMGKNVIVGRSNTDKQKVGNRKFWTNEKIIHDNYTGTDRAPMKGAIQQDWGVRSPTHTFAVEHHVSSESNIFPIAAESSVSHAHLNWQAHALNQIGSPTMSRCLKPSFNQFGPPPTTSTTVFDRAVNFQKPILPEVETLPLIHTPGVTCQQNDVGPANSNFKHNVPHASNKSFDFPFLLPDSNENTRSYTPGLLHENQELRKTNPKSFWDDFATGSNLMSAPSTSYSPIVPYPHNQVMRHSCAESLASAASMFDYMPPPPFSGVRRDPFQSMINRNRTQLRQQSKPNAFAAQGSGYSQRANKRYGATEYPTKPSKLPYLGLQEGLQAITKLVAEDSSRNMQYNAEVDSSMHKAGTIDSIPVVAPFDKLKLLPDMDFSKDSTTGSGPVKLCAGAKHVLQPRHDIDHDDLMRIRSSVPLVSLTDPGSFSGPQEQATEVYRF